MSAKRPPLSLKPEGFAAHAIPQPDPVVVAMALPLVAPNTDIPQNAKPTGGEGTKEGKAPVKAGQPSRVGKVQVVAWVSEERRTELIVAAKPRRTVDDLLTSMIDDLVTRNLGN